MPNFEIIDYPVITAQKRTSSLVFVLFSFLKPHAHVCVPLLLELSYDTVDMMNFVLFVCFRW